MGIWVSEHLNIQSFRLQVPSSDHIIYSYKESNYYRLYLVLQKDSLESVNNQKVLLQVGYKENVMYYVNDGDMRYSRKTTEILKRKIDG